MIKSLRKVKNLFPGDLVSTNEDLKTKPHVAFVVSVSYQKNPKEDNVIFMLLGEDNIHAGKTISDHYLLLYRHEQNLTDPKRDTYVMGCEKNDN